MPAERWKSIIIDLVTKFWQNKWKETYDVLIILNSLLERVHKALEYLDLRCSFSKILNSDEWVELQLPQIFDSFLACLNVTLDITDAYKWEASIKSFDLEISRAEKYAAEKLKTALSQLVNEKQSLISHINTEVQSLLSSIRESTEFSVAQGDMPSSDVILSIRQNVLKDALSGVQAAENLLHFIAGGLEELNNMELDFFNVWVQNCNQALDLWENQFQNGLELVSFVKDSKLYTWEKHIMKLEITVNEVLDKAGVPPSQKQNTPWDTHLDHQLFKLALLVLSQCLHTWYQHNLIYNSKVEEIQLKEKMEHHVIEDGRSTFYRDIRKHLSPIKELRVTCNVALFEDTFELCGEQILQQIDLGECIVEALDAAQTIFAEWDLLKDLHGLIAFTSNSLLLLEDWEDVFRALKSKGQQVAIIPTEVQFVGVAITTSQLKLKLEEYLQSMFDVLQWLCLQIKDNGSNLQRARETLTSVLTERQKAEIQMKFAAEENALLKKLTGQHLQTALNFLQRKMSEIKSFEEALDLLDSVLESKQLKQITYDMLLNLQATIKTAQIQDDIDLELKNFSALNIQMEEDLKSFNLLSSFQELLLHANNSTELFSSSWLYSTLIEPWKQELLTIRKTSITSVIESKLHQLQILVKTTQSISGEVWTDEHWQDFYSVLQKKPPKDPKLVSRSLILNSMEKIILNAKEIENITIRASQEAPLRQALLELESWVTSPIFAFRDHATLQGRNTPSPQFAQRGGYWEARLGQLSDCLAILAAVQRKWIYLEPIYGQNILSSEGARFQQLDSKFSALMNQLCREKRMLEMCITERVHSTVTFLHEQLELCQKALAEFLEEKRSCFPRFYFVGDDDLLEMLGQGTDKEKMQSHLHKIFTAIGELLFSDQCDVVAIKSTEGEVVSLSSKDTPQQVVELAEYIKFSSECEEIMDGKQSFSQMLAKLKTKLGDFNKIVHDGLYADNQSGHLTLKAQALILDTIHRINVVKSLYSLETIEKDDWSWKKQLRFYLQDDDNMIVCMGEARLPYSWEYQGNGSKLVHTELTDKCFLSLFQALKDGYGGNPFGPAGTGKTESVKALGSLLGRQVLVFNCDEGLDYAAIGRTFMGLCKVGAWGCFDEFNRLEELVMSAVSVLIRDIQASLKNEKKLAKILGLDVHLDCKTAIFITLNPASKEYGGRQQLPDNLKQLFRPIAMTHPNNASICDILLSAEGFKDSTILAVKIVTTLMSCKETLSCQKQYDWGLRTIKTVLIVSGRLLRSHRSGTNDSYVEEQCVLEALHTTITPRLKQLDSQNFSDILMDIFSGHGFVLDQESKDKGELWQCFEELGLQPNSVQLKTCKFFLTSLETKMGVALIGRYGTGKSTIWKVVLKFYQKTKKIKVHYIQPKATCKEYFWGVLNSETREWEDGILIRIARDIIQNPTITHWVICDGDIDPEWIEALNSVLDDNHILTVPNGERFHFGANVHFIFEASDFKYASPATVSRLSVIHLTEQDFTIKLLLDGWALKLSEVGEVQMRTKILKPIFLSFLVPEDIQPILQKKFPDYFESVNCKDNVPNSNYPAHYFYLQNALSILMENGENILLIGPRGSGKLTLVRELLSISSSSSRIIYCSATTSGKDIVDNILEMGTVHSSADGKPDKYESVEVIAMLQQLLCFHGFYDFKSKEWVTIKQFQIITTINSDRDMGMRALFFGTPTENILVDVCNQMLSKVLHKLDLSDKDGCIVKLAKTMVSILSSIREHTKDMSLSSKHLIHWIDSLAPLEITPSSDHVKHLLTLVSIKGCRLLVNGLKSQFKKLALNIISTTIAQHWDFHIETSEIVSSEALFAPSHANNYRDEWTHSLNNTSEFITSDQRLYLELIKDALTTRFGAIGGSTILWGRSGMGRSRSCSFVAEMLGFKCQTIAESANLTLRSIQNDFKNIFYSVGIDAQKILLIVEKHHLTSSPRVLCYLNDLLGAGKLCGLYTKEELQLLVQSLSTECSNDSYSGGLIDYFWDRVSQNLHIAVILNVDDPDAHNLYQLAPTIADSCTKIWFDDWSILNKQELTIARMGNNNILDELLDSEKKTVMETIVKVDETIDSKPAQFISFLETYENILNKSWTTNKRKLDHLEKGVDKLHSASECVAELSEQAESKKASVEALQKSADADLEDITEKIAQANLQKVAIQDLQVKLSFEKQNLVEKKDATQKELQSVEPLLLQAKCAVGEIRTENLAEIRSLRAPPAVIRDVLEGLLRLLGIKDMSWSSMKAFLGKRNVKDEIINFQAENITPSIRESVKMLIFERPGSLAIWVKANIAYSDVLAKVAPLQEQLNTLENNLLQSHSALEMSKSQLKGIEDCITEQKTSFASKMRDAEVLRAELQAVLLTKSKAEDLLEKLQEEGKRWTSEVKNLQENLKSCPLTSIITAAVVAFFGQMEEQKRKLTLEKCEHDRITWKSMGLQDDRLALENASIILTTTQTPLIIDASSNILQWLKQATPQDNGIEVVDFCSKNSVTENLLSLALQKLIPTVENERAQLVAKDQQLRIELHKLEETLLKCLAEAEGNILDDQSLIESLSEVKEKSASISNSLEKSVILQQKLQQEQNTFFGFAHHSENISVLVTELEKQLFGYLKMSSFEEDWVPITLYISQKLKPEEFPKEDWDTICKESYGMVLTSQMVPSWFPKKHQHNTSPAYMDLAARTFRSEASWKEWIDSGSPYNLLGKQNKSISAFQRFLLVKNFHPDKLHKTEIFAIDESHLKRPSLDKIMSITSAIQPILVKSESGTNPLKEILRLASNRSQDIEELVIGSMSLSDMMKVLESCTTKGTWLCLQNVHLASQWVSNIPQELKKMESRVNSSFRLWLIAEDHEKFPENFLSSCFKIVVNVPKVQGRSTFIPQGWMEKYGFSVSDLWSSANLLVNVIKTGNISKGIQSFSGIVENIYSGHIGSAGDTEKLKTLLLNLICKNLSDLGNSYNDLSGLKETELAAIGSSAEEHKNSCNGPLEHKTLSHSSNGVWEEMLSHLSAIPEISIKVPEPISTFFHTELEDVKKICQQEAQSLRLQMLPTSQLGSSDTITLEFIYQESGSKMSEDGTIQDVDGDDDAVSCAPNCYISWLPNEMNMELCTGAYFPLFLDGSRQKYICDLQVINKDAENKWKLFGTAFIILPEM
ncbi:hypothetical protein M427DRAFT_41773 [Gonapodya prolifera JEL478]|uniref:Dynein heavy chain, cytoplasmic n=1 Tax=Gonapodya prolifera (strain JEL478) TaxID=1344416 RepID=A0A139ARK7_GONPJ|nr:hypothetical protein M427DRAFT_41773 [Gonapodya prolifera JEL478]|eukprot:KXS19391.1 hypothetical protein M427DRAFT_41773 [Gonapodya prolifera JEL478]